tara:strand:+ start:2658 stop:2912 length:255 start_codon:yes stop_codon:yes gene_type:complete
MTPHPSLPARLRARNGFVDTLGADFISADAGFDALNPVVAASMKAGAARMVEMGVRPHNAAIYVALNAARWYWSTYQFMLGHGE